MYIWTPSLGRENLLWRHVTLSQQLKCG